MWRDLNRLEDGTNKNRTRFNSHAAPRTAQVGTASPSAEKALGVLVSRELQVSQQHMQCIQLIPKTSPDKSKWMRVSCCKVTYILTHQIMEENKSDLILYISQISVMSLTRFLSNTGSFSVLYRHGWKLVSTHSFILKTYSGWLF